MNKYFLAFPLIALFASGCNVLQVRELPASDIPAKKSTRIPANEVPSIFTKSYQFKTGQSYTRAVERTFYGKQVEMQPELSKYDIRKGFNIEQYNKYNKASFFQTDVYKIPDDLKVAAIDLFAPLLDTVFLSLQSKKALHAEILVLGYTDEAAIPIDAPVYNELLTFSKQREFVNNDYYNTLSFYRAVEVAQLLTSILNNKKDAFLEFEKASIDIIIEGRGIEYPDAKRTYELEDDKRKITKVYWKVY